MLYSSVCGTDRHADRSYNRLTQNHTDGKHRNVWAMMPNCLVDVAIYGTTEEYVAIRFVFQTAQGGNRDSVE